MMYTKLSRPLLASAVTALAFLALSSPAEAQILDRVKETAERAAEREVLNEVDRFVRNAVKCAFDDLDCIQSAKDDGEDVVLTDEDGEVMYDEEGQPITDPSQLPEDRRATVDANYDFEPGSDVLVEDDFSEEELGDFPRNMTYVRGNMEVVDYGGRRLLRATSNSRLEIPLPEALPEQFTVEFAFHDPATEGGMALYTDEPETVREAEAHYFNFGSWQGSGIWKDGSPLSTQGSGPMEDGVVMVRIMADGSQVRAYVDRTRIANVPNADLPRTDKLVLVMSARGDRPMFLGDLRIAAGGRDLYDVLAKDGRVAVQDIHFDSGKATIRSESAETLEQIGTMLREHPELKLMIEGHTDAEGDFDANMTLSRDRAASVKAYLVENFEIEADRLRTMGLGSTQPVADNDTEEGRQENRRVELVQIGG